MPNRPYLALVALAGTLAGATVAAHAQPLPSPAAIAPAASGAMGGAHHHRRGNRIARILRTLNLTDAQRARVRTAMQNYRAARRAGTPQTRPQLVATIEAALTPTQRATFEREYHARPATGSAPR